MPSNARNVTVHVRVAGRQSSDAVRRVHGERARGRVSVSGVRATPSAPSSSTSVNDPSAPTTTRTSSDDGFTGSLPGTGAPSSGTIAPAAASTGMLGQVAVQQQLAAAVVDDAR